MTTDNKWPGGGIPFGYRYEETLSSLVINQKELKILRLIFQLAMDGVGISRIANELNDRGLSPRRGKLWTAVIISYILSKDRLLFYMGLNKSNEKASWPQVLEVSEYEKLIKVFQDQSALKFPVKRKKTNYLLSGYGILKCGYCGGNVKASVTKSGERKILYYYCSRRQNSGSSACNKSKLHRQEIVDKVFISELREKTTEPKLTQITSFLELFKKKRHKEISELLRKAELSFSRTEPIEINKSILALKDNLYFLDQVSEEMRSLITPSQFDGSIVQDFIVSSVSEIILNNETLTIIYNFPISEDLAFQTSICLNK